jgi:tetratricopeptide (TPR) repeat protein
MKRFIFHLALGLCLVALISHHNTIAAADTWVSVRTKNFLLVGNADEKSIKQVGLKLEQFREVFTYLFPTMKFNTPVPTTVVVFKSDSAYGPFKPKANTAGHFQPGPDVNYIALSTEVRGEQDPFSIIFHEYTHLLVENTFENSPVWFNEGLAEYYSTFSITNDQNVVVGNPVSGHVFLLREKKMLPLRTMFEVDYKSPHYNEKNKLSIFYAQSWALMHYLIIGKNGKGEQLGKFMQLLASNVPAEQAFQQAFGMPLEEMEKELRNYVKQDRYNINRGHFERKLEFDTTTKVTTLSEAEAHAYLGDLLVHGNRAEAHTYLQRALKLDPNLAMAHASLGMAYFREGRTSQARASLERAIAANSQNYLIHYYYAFTLSRSGPNELPPVAGYPADVAAKMREHLKKAISLRPDFPESYSLLAFLTLLTGQDIDEVTASLKRVSAASPGRHDIAFMLAQLLLRKGDFKPARELLEQVKKSNADEHTRKHSEALLGQISSFEQELARYETVKKPAVAKDPEEDSEAVKKPPISKTSAMTPVVTSGSGTTNFPEPAPASDPSYYLREVLRRPAAGETQLQGILQKIECPGRGMVFLVQTPTGLLRLRTASFDDIELTTYDPKVNGEIGCGVRKPENTVIVCYIPNTDKRIKADGILKSIEFVPEDFKLKPPA